MNDVSGNKLQNLCVATCYVRSDTQLPLGNESSGVFRISSDNDHQGSVPPFEVPDSGEFRGEQIRCKVSTYE